jgi:DnaK suppressor protein
MHLAAGEEGDAMTCHVARNMAEFERRLHRDRRELRHTLATTDAELANVERPGRGELADEAAKETVCRLLARLEERDRRTLAEIEAAEARLSAGTFGICQTCAAPIPVPRLRALPTARLCVACEEIEERAGRRP